MRISLRPTNEDDLPYVLAAQSDADTRGFIVVWREERHRSVISDANIEHLIVVSEPDSRPVGFAILAGLNGEHRSIEFMRLVIAEKGRGYGGAAVKAITCRAFSTHRAHRLWLDVKERNVRARAVYGKAGFRQEGTLRECLASPEGFESLVVMSILEHEHEHAAPAQTPRRPD